MSGQSGILNIALAFNKPIIASDVGGISEVIINGETGYLVPPRNPVALAEAIICLLNDNAKRELMSENLRELSSQLSWDNIALKHINIYTNILINTK